MCLLSKIMRLIFTFCIREKKEYIEELRTMVNKKERKSNIYLRTKKIKYERMNKIYM